MNAKRRGLLLAVVHVVMLTAVLGKYAYERETLPRVWAETQPYDPYMPLRGRYVSIQLIADSPEDLPDSRAVFEVRNNRLVAVKPRDGQTGLWVTKSGDRVTLTEPLAYFIPDRGPDPSRVPANQRLWVEVSVPQVGPPRPLRLEVRPVQ